MSDHLRQVLKTCSTCHEEFANIRELITHEMQHRKSSSSSIVESSLSKSSISSVTNNASSVVDGLVCEFCYGSFGYRSSVIPHQRRCHFIDTGSPFYYCSICFDAKRYGPLDRTYFREAKHFLRHMNTEHGIEYSPTGHKRDKNKNGDSADGSSKMILVSQEEILDRVSMQSEQKRERESECTGTYLCKYCFCQFVHLNALSKHIKSRHRVDDQNYYYYCDRCYCRDNRIFGSVFDDESAFRAHMVDRHDITMSNVEKHARSGTSKVNRSDLLRSDLPRKVRRCDFKARMKAIGDNDSSVGHSKTAADNVEVSVVLKRELDDDGLRASTSTSVPVVSEPSSVHSPPRELRSVKEEPIDEASDVDGEQRILGGIRVMVKSESGGVKCEMSD